MPAKNFSTPQEWLETYAIPVPESGCWIFEGGISNSGYGIPGTRRRGYAAHRVSWEMFNGTIPDGLCVLHICDVRLCINPKHLFLGTRTDNFQDMVSKNRLVSRLGKPNKHQKTHCIRGHVLTYPSWSKCAHCTKCATMRTQKWQERRR